MSKNTNAKKDFSDLKKDTGFLHISGTKTQKESPDFFGTMDINGVIFALGGWNKKGEKSGDVYISLNLDIASLTTDEKKEARDSYLKDLLEDKKKPENKDAFVLMEQTGTLHSQNDSKKEEDYFGSALINGEKIYLLGFMIELKGKSVLKLQVSKGLRTKEERKELAKAFKPSK